MYTITNQIVITEFKERFKINKVNIEKPKVCILGAGNGGLAAASDLTIRGFKVTLAELPEFRENIEEVQNKGGIFLETLDSTGLEGGFAEIYKVTSNISEAISEADIVLIITPSFAHKKIAEKSASFLKADHTVLLAPGNLGGSIEFYNHLVEFGGDKNIFISELECMMYACRKKDENTIYVRGFKESLGFATFPASATNNEFNKVKEIYPNIVKRNNILETGFSNINPILHVPILISNLSNIDNKKDILMYHDALTKSISNIAESMDKERMSLNTTSQDIQLLPMKKIYKGWYYHQGSRGDSFEELAGKNPIYYESKLPQSLNHRYLIEDIPYGLIPMLSILEKFNGQFSSIKSVINMANVITGCNYYEQARTLESLSLQDKNKSQILNYIKYRN